MKVRLMNLYMKTSSIDFHFCCFAELRISIQLLFLVIQKNSLVVVLKGPLKKCHYRRISLQAKFIKHTCSLSMLGLINRLLQCNAKAI